MHSAQERALVLLVILLLIPFFWIPNEAIDKEWVQEDHSTQDLVLAATKICHFPPDTGCGEGVEG